MSHLRPIVLVSLVSSLAASGCAEPGAPLDLGVQCGDVCDQANTTTSQTFARVGRFGPPAPVVCQLFSAEHRVACNWLGSGDHPIAIQSASVTVTPDGGSARSLGVLGSANQVASVSVPPDTTSVRIDTRMAIDEIGCTARGTSSLQLPAAETLLDGATAMALVAAPVELWRLELLGVGTDTILHLVTDDDADAVPLPPGARKTVDVAVARKSENVPFWLETGAEPLSGAITEPTVLAVSDRGIAVVTPEQMPHAGAGAVALSCTRDSASLHCTIPNSIGADVGKVTVRVWSAAGDWRQFQVSPYFGGGSDLPAADDELSVRAYVQVADDVRALPYDVPPRFEVEATMKAGDSADFHLPINFVRLTLGATSGPETLVFDVPTLELGRTLEGWYEYQPDSVSETIGRAQLDTTVTVAVPAGQDTVQATLKYGLGGTGEHVELRSGTWWLTPDGLASGS